eukprot:235489_1
MFGIYIYISLAFGMMFVVIDVLLSIGLLYLFVKKLFELVGQIGADLNAQNHTQKLISVMTRCTLLYSICFSSTMIVFILLSLTPMRGRPGYQQLIWIFVSIDSLVNMTCNLASSDI